MDVYVQQTLLLARSIVFKSTISADRQNADLIKRYGASAVDLDRPRTWKYYQNLAGIYHSTDTMMKVISLDTQEWIDFTVQNMVIHTATAVAYRYGTRYYYALLRKYPNQGQLIMAINNPANIDQAIAAKDGDILAYYKYLVEPQEYTLMYEVEKYIKNYFQRYTVVGFQNVRTNYPVINYAILYQSLPGMILNQRLQDIKTDKTHSFHITQYLASHGRLDRFMPYMTLKQKLYLYHNIDFIEKHAGMTSTFEELIQWVLNDRFIPLSSYTVRQLQEHNRELYPELRARRTPLGTLFNTAEAEYLPISSLYDKEIPLQAGNRGYFLDNEKTITRSLENSPSSVIQTKGLESAMVDYTDSTPDQLPTVLMRQWAYMSSQGLYEVLTNFTHPFTGETISIIASDALIYYSYIFMCGIGKEPKYVPNFVDVKYRLHPRPNVNILYKDLVPARFPDLKQIANELVSSQPDIVQCFSVSAFFDLTYKVFQESQKHWMMTSAINDPMKRGIAAKMISRLFGIEELVLAPPQSDMKAWLAGRHLPEFTGNYTDSLELCNIIFQSATGYTITDTKSLAGIQKAMIEMFTQLSSYTIQIMRDINDSAVLPLNWAAIRIGSLGESSSEDAHIVAPVRVFECDGTIAENAFVQNGGDLVKSDTDLMPQESFIETGVYVHLCEGVSNTTQAIDVQIPSVRIFEAIQPKLTAYQPFLPNDYYDNLTDSQRMMIAKQYISEVL